MQLFTLPMLAGWINFYVIVGSSAGALTGLQFVVMTLINETDIGGGMREIHAFGTPTVVQFCSALLVSALMAAPWHRPQSAGSCLVVVGSLGVLYGSRVVWHARKSNYNPDLEDWIWYAALPILTYASLAASGVFLSQGFLWSTFWTAATDLSFLFVGIHNAWDTVTYLATSNKKQKQEGRSATQPE